MDSVNEIIRFVSVKFNELNSSYHPRYGVPASSFIYLTALVFSIVLIQLVFRLNSFLLRQCRQLQLSPVPETFTKLPSPPIIGPLFHILYYRNDLPTLFLDWTIKYGPNVHVKIFGKHFVMLNDPKLVQKLLMSGDLGHVQKPHFFYRRIFTDSLVNGMVSSKPDIWKSHRAILTKSFTYEALKSYLHIYNTHSQKLIDELRDLTQKDQESANFSFLEKMHITTFGVISHIITGTDMLTDKECTTFYLNFHRAQEIVSSRLLQPWLLVDPLWNIHPMKKELHGCIDQIAKDLDKVHKMLREEASKAFPGNEYQFKSLLEVMEASEMSDLEIQTEMASILLAGHDTVSVSLNFVIYNLALNLNHQKACREEIDNMFNSLSENEECLNHDITMDKLNELKYTERCIKESLRIYPSVPLICRELGSPLKLDDGSELGRGVTVLISPWTLHRNPDYYPDPEKYDPDRFLTENCQKRSSGSYIPFSIGPRNCLGWKLAMMEIKVLVANIIRHFEIYTNDSPENIKLKFNIVLGTEKKLNIFFKRRQF